MSFTTTYYMLESVARWFAVRSSIRLGCDLRREVHRAPVTLTGNQWKKITELGQTLLCMRAAASISSLARRPSSGQLGHEADTSTRAAALANAVEDVVKRSSETPRKQPNLNATIDCDSLTALRMH
jgi:hypothetical protein